ncbi:hypothetical protein LJ737_13770 [Hymenobacter sp. 15J16-1T3B]|nr:phosphate acyltransferase [Hymenobacter sp. 15J16-1T3B]MCC3158312.1 hypothetical protein [Hymenobacter sp. 15J16-1T3B]
MSSHKNQAAVLEQVYTNIRIAVIGNQRRSSVIWQCHTTDPVLPGLNKPVHDLSRGGTVGDVFNTVVITANQSQQGLATGAGGSEDVMQALLPRAGAAAGTPQPQAEYLCPLRALRRPRPSKHNFERPISDREISRCVRPDKPTFLHSTTRLHAFRIFCPVR